MGTPDPMGLNQVGRPRSRLLPEFLHWLPQSAARFYLTVDANGNQPRQSLQFLQAAHYRIRPPCRLLSGWGNSRPVDPNGNGLG